MTFNRALLIGCSRVLNTLICVRLRGVYADPEKAVDALIEEALGEPAADLDAYFNQ
jgi:hypothetical protein